MTPKQFYKKYLSGDKARLEAVARDAGTTFGNFKQIAIADGSVSAKMAKALEKASGGEMTLNEILFPEEINDSAA